MFSFHFLGYLDYYYFPTGLCAYRIVVIIVSLHYRLLFYNSSSVTRKHLPLFLPLSLSLSLSHACVTCPRTTAESATRDHQSSTHEL